MEVGQNAGPPNMLTDYNSMEEKQSNDKTSCSLYQDKEIIKRLVWNLIAMNSHFMIQQDIIKCLPQTLYSIPCRLGDTSQYCIAFSYHLFCYDGMVNIWKNTDDFNDHDAHGSFKEIFCNKIILGSVDERYCLLKDNIVGVRSLFPLINVDLVQIVVVSREISLPRQDCLQVSNTTKKKIEFSWLDAESKQLVQELKNENHVLKQKNFALEQMLIEKDNFLKERKSVFYTEKMKLMEEKRSLENELRNLRDIHEQLSEEHQETLHDLGLLSFERAANLNKIKRAKIFQEIFDTKKSSGSVDTLATSGSTSSSNKLTPCCGQGLNSSHNQQHVCRLQNMTEELPNSSQFIPRETLEADNELVESRGPTPVNQNEASDPNNSRDERSGVVPSLSVEVDKPSEGESMSLRNEPSSSLMAEVRNIYKLLLITIADKLLFDDIAKLKEWANERFAFETNLSATEIVHQLDQEGVINAFDLNQLHAFFESILRFDLVHLIDEFTKGDYPSLRKLISVNNPKRQNRVSNSNRNQQSVVLMRNSTLRPSMSPSVFNSDGTNNQALERSGESTKNGNMSNVNNHGDWSRKLPNFRGLTSSVPGNSVAQPDEPATNRHGGNISYMHGNNVTNSDTPWTSGKNNAMKMPVPSFQDRSSHGPSKQCNGTSQAQPRNRCQTSNNHNMQEKKWLCSHYKRRCYVKFDCCEKFWPCHQCHNKESTCGRKNLKARDTKMVKCFECGKEQQFGEFCVSCNIKFASFYCGLCKHVTGTDDFPYHCEKCGICRIHGDRSFHCDTCGVCLDVQLRGNHKCRPDSAHDQCCICLEDAFTGCQILPCSHKVHKQCATQMIQSGITRCPICRESFAHKLNKRQPAKKLIRRR